MKKLLNTVIVAYMDLVKIFESVRLADKWKQARDSVHTLFTIFDKVNGEKKFKERMKLIQTLIFVIAEQEKLDTMKTMIKLSSETEDERWAIQIIAAGYELSNGNDYTKDESIIVDMDKLL